MSIRLIIRHGLYQFVSGDNILGQGRNLATLLETVSSEHSPEGTCPQEYYDHAAEVLRPLIGGDQGSQIVTREP